MGFNYRTEELISHAVSPFAQNPQPMKKIDKQGSINDIMDKMEQRILYDEYMKSQDKYYKTPKVDNEQFDTYKKQLKNLGVSFDQFKGWYYQKHPTPEMQAWDNAGEMMDNYLKDKLGVNNQNNVIGTNNNTQSNGFINSELNKLKEEEQKLKDVANNTVNDFVRKSAFDKLDANRAKQKELQNQNKGIKFTPSKRRYKFTKLNNDNRVVL